MTLTTEQLAHELPDIPRFVETRSMLLTGCELFGLRRDNNDWHFASLDRIWQLLSVVGKPASSAILQAVNALGREGIIITPTNDPLEITGWSREMAILYEQTRRIRAPQVEAATADWLTADSLPSTVPADLREELVRALSDSPIAATFRGDDAVSFCYADCTETLWDVSIDTLEQHRGRGYAGMCVDFLIDAMAAEGRRPVWGALTSNIPSQRLAAKLGFTPVDEIAVYERNSETR